MDVISKLPEKKGVVGAKEIAKAARAGKVKHVIAASNCPSSLMSPLEGTGVKVDRFEGDASMLGTKLGKPFPVAMVGYQ